MWTQHSKNFSSPLTRIVPQLFCLFFFLSQITPGFSLRSLLHLNPQMFSVLEIREGLYAPVLQWSVTCTCPNFFHFFFVSSVLKFSDPFICILYLVLSKHYFDVFLTTWAEYLIILFFILAFLVRNMNELLNFFHVQSCLRIESPTHSPSSDSLGASFLLPSLSDIIPISKLKVVWELLICQLMWRMALFIFTGQISLFLSIVTFYKNG